MIPLNFYLFFAAALFSIGLAGVLIRRNTIAVLISLELMFNAANINFIAFWRYGLMPEQFGGYLFTLFSIAIAAAEVAIGLALAILIYRKFRNIEVDRLNDLKEDIE